MSPVGSNWKMDPPLDHPHPARLREEISDVHIQCSASMAAENGWYWRRDPRYSQLEPDTRRCYHCGEVLFAPLDLTQQEKDIRHPLSTNVLLGEPSQP